MATTEPEIPDFTKVGAEVVVGLDISIAKAGIAAINVENPQDFGTAVVVGDPPDGHFVRQRITRLVKHATLITQKVRELLKERRGLVMVEDYVHSPNGTTTLILAELGGILRSQLLGVHNVIDIVPVPVSTMRKFVTGDGSGGDKTKTATKLARRFDIEIPTEDEWDAYGIGTLGLALVGKLETTDDQKVILRNLFVTKRQQKKARSAAKLERKLERERAAKAQADEREAAKASRAAAAAAKEAEKKKREAERAAAKAQREAAAAEKKAAREKKAAEKAAAKQAPKKAGKKGS